MASWVTHLMIADKVLKDAPWLDRRGFCVGNIAPDCNVENKDWSSFTPTREVTHFMSGREKSFGDAVRFYEEYILKNASQISSAEHYSFLWGYFAHLAADACFFEMIRSEERVRSVWSRIKSDERLRTRARGMTESWDNAKLIFEKGRLNRELHTLEAEYLSAHPRSGYLTEIKTLKEFPDYMDFLPCGSIVRKIGIMGYLPNEKGLVDRLFLISDAEHSAFINKTVNAVNEMLDGEKAGRFSKGNLIY